MFLVAIEYARRAKGADLLAEMNLGYRAFQGNLRTKPSFHCVQQLGGRQPVFTLQRML